MTTAIGDAWSALDGDPSLLARVTTVVREGALQARLPVRDLARACAGACALAAAELGARRAGLTEVPGVRVDDGALATAFSSERQLLVDGRAPVAFAPLSRFWQTADGWVRTHANYPHHRARLLDALRLPQDATADDVAARLAGQRATEVEETVYGTGGLAVALRTPEQWAAHPQSAAVAARPLVEREQLGRARAGLPPLSGIGIGIGSGTGSGSGSLLPASGLRVLDLTRVLAGPVATRTLGLLGADVLRVDPPRSPELPDQHADTGFGKRTTALDLSLGADRATFEELLSTADVVVTGYRPGALDRYGLSPEALAEHRPGLVVAQVSAWGAYGPWAGRRGFDSLVQVASGIAVLQGSPSAPGALPVQALDHGTGYLLAAAVLRALTERAEQGHGAVVRLALARTAAWLTGGTGDAASDPGGAAAGRRGEVAYAGPGMSYEDSGAPYGAPDAWLAETDSALGRLRYARSPVTFAGGPTDWTRPPAPWGSDAARWL